MLEWRRGSAAPLHGDGRRFNPVLEYQINAALVKMVLTLV